MMFVSGVFFPTDTLPSVMRVVVRYLPLTPLIQAMRDVSLDGASVSGIWWPTTQLAIWIGVTFGLAALTFRFSED